MHPCECPGEGTATTFELYVPAEYKAMKHAPGQCPGDYQTRRYLRGGQTWLWLCSACDMFDDVAVALGSDGDDQGGEA